jgi:pimeloyl-ACP methyl ester carboxylesterase
VIDRLSGYVNQGNIQVDMLVQMAKQLRSGKYTGNIGNPSKIILVGHSFGSAISLSTLASAPEVADAVVFTGLNFLQNFQVVTEAMAPRIASLQNEQWSELDSGYVTWADIYANINR